MFPLTGNPEIDKDLAEEHQRELLEDAEAEAIIRGEAHEGDYQPVTEDKHDMITTPKRNRHIKHGDK